MQSFQPGSKFRFFVFQAVVLAFFFTVLAQTSAQAATSETTTTSLSVSTQQLNSRTSFTFGVTVKGQSTVPTGTVTITDGTKLYGSAALDTSGLVELVIDAIPAGKYQFSAVYNGDSTHSASTSSASSAESITAGLSDYTFRVQQTNLVVTAGQNIATTVKLMPENGFSQYASFSCSGLPLGATCTFTPTTVSAADAVADPDNNGVLATSTTLTIQTTSLSGAQLVPQHSSGLYYALAAPGILALVGLGGLYKRWRFASQTLFMALLVTLTLGLSSCAARYNYFHHGPPTNTGTPAGSYSLKLTTSSDNGIKETTHTIPIALVVK